MRTYDTPAASRGGRFHIPRSRGAASGVLLVLLGIWGALIPFVGPYFDFAYSPDRPWVWTEARGWLEVLPGAVTVLGGLLLLMTRNRATAMLGGWLAVAGGAWFIVGRAFASMLAIGEIGVPAAATPAKTVALELAYFSGLGALIVFLGAAALGRVSIRSVRDLGYAERRAALADGKVESTPATSPQPAVAASTADSPRADHPMADQPRADHPMADQPRADQPTEVIERKEPAIKRWFGRRHTPVAH